MLLSFSSFSAVFDPPPIRIGSSPSCAGTVGEHVIEGDVIVTVLLWIIWMKGDSPSRPVLNATLLSVAGISVCAVAMAAVM